MYTFERNKLKEYLGDCLYKKLKEYRCFVAGGTITSLFCNREINDVDIYFRNKEDIKDFILKVVKKRSMWIVAKTKKALLLKYNDILIQLICFDTFITPEEIFNTFDFTVCMGCYDFEKECFVFHDDFLKHNSQRILMFNKSTAYPIVSALRVDKYKQKGYLISKTEYLRVLLTCMDLHIDNYQDLKEQLGGMYGVDYDEIIKPLEGEKFDLSEVIIKMSEIINHPDYFKKKSTDPIEIDNWDIFTKCIIGEKISVYEFKERYFIYEDGDFTDVTCDVDGLDFDILPIEDILSPGFIIYKNVICKDGVIKSCYDNKFEYKINEYAVGRGVERWGERRDIGIFGCLDVKQTRYATGGTDNTTIIELKVDSVDDVIAIDGKIEVKKATPIRILSVEEVNKVREGEEDLGWSCI